MAFSNRGPCKVDANHAEIVKALRKAGAFVVDLSAVGKGCPDLAVLRPGHKIGEGGRTVWLECKDGRKQPSARSLTPDQLDWHAQAMMAGCPVQVVTDVPGAIAAVFGGSSCST